MSKKSKKLPTNVIPSTLTGKQIKSLLFNDNKIKDQELAEFTKLFYHRLADVNTKRDSFPRVQEDRRLDAIARLLVGDETCAAVSFDEATLLIATNKNSHSKDVVKFKINFLIKEDKYAVNQYQFYPVIYISLNEMVPTRVLIDNPATYYYRKRDDSFILTSASPKEIDATLSPTQHLLPHFPAIPIGPHIKPAQNIPLHTLVIVNRPLKQNELSLRLQFIKEDICKKGEVELEGLTVPIPQNSLQRRAELLAQHIIKIITITHMEKNLEELRVQQCKSNIDDYRATFLMNSLTWEAIKWYPKHVESLDRNHLSNKTVEIQDFIQKINQSFNNFKSINASLKNVTLIESWLDQLIIDIKEDKIEIPDFIKHNIEKFKIKQYFIDLIKVEEYFKAEALKNNSELVKAFIKQSKLFAKTFAEEGTMSIDQSFIKIIDNHEDGVHCEIRILCYYLQQGKIPKYIATSLLCCAHCKLVMDYFKIEIIDTDENSCHFISGTHAKAYSKWVLPSFFKDNDEYLKSFLGDSLYESFKQLKNINTEFGGKTVSKADLALKIIENIASLDQETLSMLDPTLIKLWNDKNMFADESDDETDSDYIETLSAHQQGELQGNKDVMINYNPEIPLPFIKEGTQLLAEETQSPNDLS